MSGETQTPLDASFYRLVVKERDYERAVNGHLRRDLAHACALLAELIGERQDKYGYDAAQTAMNDEFRARVRSFLARTGDAS